MIELLNATIEREVTSERLASALEKHGEGLPPDRLKDLAALLERFLRSVPKAIAVALLATKDEKCGRAVALATGQILNYVFDEDDLLPERTFGILGLLDDAYLVHVYVGTLSRMYPHLDTSGAGYEPPDQRAFSVVRAFLPAGVADALVRTCDGLLQVASALFGSGGQGGSPAETSPAVRVTEALQAMSGSCA